MTPGQILLGVCTVLYGSIYLTACVILGVYFGQSASYKLALVAMGFCYLSFMAQLAEWRYVPQVVHWLAIICGGLAGILLLR